MKTKLNIIDGLNEQQKEAVVNYQGPSLIIAGAGSGKTKTITHRIAYMLQQNVLPERIMALTFTNKAAEEMKNRIAQMISYKTAQKLWMGTFHSIFRKILKNEAEKIGYQPNFTIYDTDDSISVIKKILKELFLNNNERYKPKDVFSRISHAKNNLITPQSYKNNVDIMKSDIYKKIEQMWQIYERYQQYLKSSNAMDFDDLLLNTNILFRDFPDTLSYYQQRFDYILVDEYQDTNYAQYLIIRKLSDKHKNICVVGDDSQSIYSFRGARIENILNFKKDYPEYSIFKLELNYRSTKTIVEAANSLIEFNKDRIPKVVYTSNEEGEKIEVLKTLTESEEAYVIANIVKDLHEKKQIPYHEIAVLYRINSQSRILEDSFRRLNIPYKIYGGTSFYQRKEIKDTLAYIRLCINEHDSESLKRIINFPLRGIGDTTVSKIENFALENNLSLWDSILQIDKIQDLNKATISKIKTFQKLILTLRESITTKTAFEFIEFLIDSTGIKTELKNEKTNEGIERLYNVEELINSIKDFETEFTETYEITPTIIDFLEHVSLITSLDETKKESASNSKITLMTAHSAKGLEFNVVFIAGVEKNKFPLTNAYNQQPNIEEERRLFYVALTRAKKKAFITFPEKVLRWGKSSELTHPSPFISNINQKYLNITFNNEITSDFSNERNFISSHNIKSAIKIQSNEKKYIPLSQVLNQDSKLPSNVISAFNIGDKVCHERFGTGTILKVEGSEPNTRVLVDFENSGQKQLLVKYAKLSLIK